VLGISLLVGLGTTPALGATPGQTCAATKTKVAGKKASGLATCDARATKSGSAVSRDCVDKVKAKFAAKWDKADARGGCATTGDRDAVEAKVDAFLVDLEAELGLTGPGSSCTSTKLSAAGKKASCKLRCYSKALKKGVAVDQACLDKCTAKFTASCGKADGAGDCHAPTGDCAALEGKVDAFVGDVAGELPSETTTTTTTTTITITTTLSTTTTTTTLPPSPSPCAGPRIVVTGTRTTTYRPSIAPDGQIDATAATFIAGPDNKYAVQVHDGPGGCWTGGQILGEFPRDLTWGEMHTLYNPTAFAIHTPGFLVEGLRIDNSGDGIKSRAENFTIRGAHLTWVRDDCIENIDKHSGLVEDSLLEECYVGMSTRSDTPGDPDAIVTIRNTLLGLVSMPGPHDSESRDPGHGNAFKDSDDSPALILENNIFFADSQTNSEGGLGLPTGARVQRCNGNIWVYTGAEPLDLEHFGHDPVTGQSCFTISRDQRVWDEAVTDWCTRHPGAC